MLEQLRSPQKINGEMLPRNYHVGAEAVLKAQQLVSVLRETGITVGTIPLLKEIELGAIDQRIPIGTVLGATTPISEHDFVQILVWDGLGISGISPSRYQVKQETDWALQAQQVNSKENLRKKPKKHKQRPTKERRGRRV